MSKPAKPCDVHFSVEKIRPIIGDSNSIPLNAEGVLWTQWAVLIIISPDTKTPIKGYLPGTTYLHSTAIREEEAVETAMHLGVRWIKRGTLPKRLAYSAPLPPWKG